MQKFEFFRNFIRNYIIIFHKSTLLLFKHMHFYFCIYFPALFSPHKRQKIKKKKWKGNKTWNHSRKITFSTKSIYTIEF